MRHRHKHQTLKNIHCLASTLQALPKAIVKGLYFNHDEGLFQAALAAGEIFETEEDGKKYYGYRQLTTGHEKGSEHSQGTQGTSKISNDAFAAMNKYMESDVLKFSFLYFHTMFNFCFFAANS